MVRPQVILSTFVGGSTDGHGQHQVAGEIAQEAFKAAADPNIFPEQLRPVKDGGAGLEPWQPLAVYSRTPFAPITNGQMLDYATGRWAPARFHNYLTGEWIEGALPGRRHASCGHMGPGARPHLRADCARRLGRAEVAIRRGKSRAQRPGFFGYHLWAVAPSAAASGAEMHDTSLFWNRKVHIDTGIAGLARLAGNAPPQWLADGLGKIQSGLNAFTSDCKNQSGIDAAHKLVPIYRERSISTRASRPAIWTLRRKQASNSSWARRSFSFKRRSRICSALTSSHSPQAAERPGPGWSRHIRRRNSA
jgi:hypothetical protein